MGIALILSGVFGAIVSGIFVSITKKYKLTIIFCNILSLFSTISLIGAMYL